MKKLRSNVHPHSATARVSSSFSYCRVVSVVVLLLLAAWLYVLFYFYTNSSSSDTIQLLERYTPKVILLELSRLRGSSRRNDDASSTGSKQVSEEDSSSSDIHIVFSTDCSFFQDWQSLLVFHTAVNVKQKGRITRIASGCDEKQQKELQALYIELYPQYWVHFTPDFKHDSKSGKKYDFYNKPYGIYHWLQHADPPVPSGTIVVIIDPDMIFLRPITSQVKGNAANIFLHSFDPESDPVPIKVQRGMPVAQLYGLGAPWTNDKHKDFNRSYVCGEGSPCLDTKLHFGEDHYSVGPPYLLEKDDLLRVVRTWTQFVPRVYEWYPDLLSEMYAYSMAAAHEQLPHFTMMSFMVSNTHANDEGWRWVDNLDNRVCEPPVDGVFYPGFILPSVLHFCQFFRAGEFGFQKRRIKKNLFDCDQPLMAALPRDLGAVDYKNRDGEIIKISAKQAKRNAFMICAVHSAMNSMLEHYKDRKCPHSSDPLINNRNKSTNVVSYSYFPW